MQIRKDFLFVCWIDLLIFQEFKIWWLVETNLFSKINFKVRHHEYEIKLSASEMIARKMDYNYPQPQPL